MKPTLKELLHLMVEKKASDLHLKVGIPPVVRKGKALVTLNKNFETLTQKELNEILSPVLNDYYTQNLHKNKQVDFSYGIKDLGRFRFNIFYQRGTLRVVVRYVPYDISDLQSLNLPPQLEKLIHKTNQGLVLITGSAGSGKTTTAMAILDYINKYKNKHIITIEDPIEFLIPDLKSLISQRELGTDYTDYNSALTASLRQDPDIIFFGEIRCTQSLATALTAANTGHLVLTTLHTKNTSETITRLLGYFNSVQSMRLEFASCLKAIIGQKLIPREDQPGFIPVVEILINNARIREILENPKKSPRILPQIIEDSQQAWGMQSFNQHLKELYVNKVISRKTALYHSDSPEKLRMFFSGLSHSNSDMEDSQNLTLNSKLKETKTSFSQELSLKEKTKDYKKAK